MAMHAFPPNRHRSVTRFRAVVVGLLLLAAGLGGFFLFQDDACQKWQEGYRGVFIEHVQRIGPVFPGDILEETIAGNGRRPSGCEIPMSDGVLMS